MDKKIFTILFICLIGLFAMSCVNATDESMNDNLTSDNMIYQITSDLSNDDVQNLLDNANDGDTFEFKNKEYNDISLIIDKKLNILSHHDSVVNTGSQITKKARDLGITNTFGFYFTSNSAGSVLSGLTIKASNSDYGVIVLSDNTTIKNNIIVGGNNGILVKNTEGVTLSNNDVSKAMYDGIYVHEFNNGVIYNNSISYNGRNGLLTSNIHNNDISYNEIHHNYLNGISMHNISKGNSIKHNDVHDNVNGIFINSTSTGDVVNANSFTSSKRSPLKGALYMDGEFETGNGLLFGSAFRTSNEGDPSRLVVKYNVLAHNQQYQAKNNPELEQFKLGDNWFDSTDDSNTLVCPMLLAGIMKMGTISVKDGIGLQMYDTKGNAVKEFGTFDTTVNIDGNQYTARFINGRATIEANLDPDKEYDIEVMIGGKAVSYKYKAASGDEGDNQNSESSLSTEGETGASGSSSQVSSGTNTGVSKGNGLNNGTSNSAHYANSDKSGVYGTNASGSFQDSSDNGNSALTNGNVNAGDSSQGEVSKEGKAYEIVPPSKISKEITDTSGLVVLSIISILGMLIYGYWRKEDYE